MLNPESTKTAAIAIVTWNSEREIGECLAPLQSLAENWEVWVADNKSSDKTVEIIRTRFPKVNLIANENNLGFAEACNQIVDRTKTDYVLFLNPDSIADRAELEKSLNEIEKHPAVGVLGIRIVGENGELNKSCGALPTLAVNALDSLGLYRLMSGSQRSRILIGDYFDHESSRNVGWVIGAFMLTRREVLDKTGGIPEDYFLFAEDMDFCYLVWKAGYKVRYYEGASVVHKSNQSAGQLPSNWRVERTALSKYAFCFNRFGAFKTRLIQITDLLGNLLDAGIVKLRKGDPAFLRESSVYRTYIAKSLKMSRREIFRLLHERP